MVKANNTGGKEKEVCLLSRKTFSGAKDSGETREGEIMGALEGGERKIGTMVQNSLMSWQLFTYPQARE